MRRLECVATFHTHSLCSCQTLANASMESLKRIEPMQTYPASGLSLGEEASPVAS